MLVGCETEKNGNLNKNDDVINNNQKDNVSMFYYDDNSISISNTDFEISCFETTTQNTNLTVTMTVTNTLTQDQVINLDSLRIVNEETKVKYKYSGATFYGDVVLQYNIKTNLVFNAVIPSSYLKDKYYILFSNQGNEYRINLYETPDELRESHMVSFKILYYPDFINVKIVSVKDNRKCEQYVYEDDSHKYYCDTWYTDEARTKEFSWSTKITQDVVLYGSKSSNVMSSGGYVQKIKHVPNDGVLVIDKYSGSVYISVYALYDNNEVKEIYFPKELKGIYNGNFIKMNSLTKIHFEGSEEEWNAIEKTSTVPSNVEIVYNSKY